MTALMETSLPGCREKHILKGFLETKEFKEEFAMADETVLEQLKYRVGERLAGKQGLEIKALDPQLLTLILEAALMVVEKCLERGPEEMIFDRMQSPGILEELMLRRSVRRLMRETYGPFGFYRHGGRETVEAILESSHSATIKDRQDFVQEVKQQMMQVPEV